MIKHLKTGKQAEVPLKPAISAHCLTAQEEHRWVS